MTKFRLDQTLVAQKLVATRSQAESLIKLGEVQVNGKIIIKPSYYVSPSDNVVVTANERYVSRAGLKLASVSKIFDLDFNNKVVLDVGSSTGGFTDFALQHGAKKVIAVDVGTNQLHTKLRHNERVELHEQTDIRSFSTKQNIDMVVMDVSFISLREVLPYIKRIAPRATIVAMVKPQFETGANLKNKGVIKNEKVRREILKDFELWVKDLFVIANKSDSKVSGAKGNLERFYLLKAKSVL
ncbi:MAG: TlyA family RNA methyltransferase [Candidatus Nomurabacteria bacterium]|nr:TlyA family RNA methyltransferase [Candidatus Saccharibacteria bacterium]USN95767.1 MAG: TlyA family RNA methyltransferase [Candidatus Nomurabacteria bacterium]